VEFKNAPFLLLKEPLPTSPADPVILGNPASKYCPTLKSELIPSINLSFKLGNLNFEESLACPYLSPITSQSALYSVLLTSRPSHNKVLSGIFSPANAITEPIPIFATPPITSLELTPP
jgi:hypothetical protein